MSKINLRKEPDGWRAYIKTGKGTVVLDGFFNDELKGWHIIIFSTDSQ